MVSTLNRVMLSTAHFVASIDIQNRTWTIAGSFPHEVRTVADNPWEGTILQNEIAELYDLEATIRSMFGVKKAEEVGGDDQPEGGA